MRIYSKKLLSKVDAERAMMGDISYIENMGLWRSWERA